jgi:hypothetical protein
VTDREAKQLGDALIERFNELARAATGDASISWQPYTSEIIFDCWGRTTSEHHCLDPKHPWPTDEDGQPTVDFEEIRQEAAEWVMEHCEEICAEIAADDSVA